MRLPQPTHISDRRQFHADLARRVAILTESQNPARAEVLRTYLTDEVGAGARGAWFAIDVVDGAEGKPPFLIAKRIEDSTRPTMLCYGHGDVIRGSTTSGAAASRLGR